MKQIITAIIAAILILLISNAVEALEVRGQVATGDFEWTAQNFAGFYYDPNNDLGTETLTTTFTEDRVLSNDQPFGVAYTTTAQAADFDFSIWGRYYAIGFLGKKYFAGYLESSDLPDADQLLFRESIDKNSLARGNIHEILKDDDSEIVVAAGTAMPLGEGYELMVKSIDVKKSLVYLDLMKAGKVVDTKIISPGKINAAVADKTYYYRKDVGVEKGLVILAVHFKNAFNDSETAIATINGLWQISEKPISIEKNCRYGSMQVWEIDPSSMQITLCNQERSITLEKGKDIELMGDLHLRTADNDELMYYVYEEVREPSSYEIRGSIATGDFQWDPQNFAGFYYDLDRNLGTERLAATLIEGNRLEEPNGLIYQTESQRNAFMFEEWGLYHSLGFLGKKYFAGYDEEWNDTYGESPLYSYSVDENSLVYEQLLQILRDEKVKKVLTKGSYLEMEQGYSLLLQGIDEVGLAYVQLFKDGQLVDSKVIAPGKDYATLLDKTYYYRKDVGEQKGLVILAVHFQDAQNDGTDAVAIVDGIWQISEDPSSVKVDEQFGKMRVASIDATNGAITLDNKDNNIVISRNKDISLLPGISLRAANSDTLIYYLYVPVPEASMPPS